MFTKTPNSLTKPWPRPLESSQLQAPRSRSPPGGTSAASSCSSARTEDDMTTKTMKLAAGRLVLAGSLLAVLSIHSAQATLGSLDPAFGTAGKVTTKLGTSNDYGYDLVQQPDG